MKTILFTDIADTPGYGKYAGTYKLATELRAAGYSCQVIDNFSWLGLDKLKILIDKFVSKETILVGFSCTLNEKRLGSKVLHWGVPDSDMIELIDYMKEKNKNVKIVAGGSRITLASDWPYIDFTVVNKADIAIIKIVEHLSNNSDLKFKKNLHTKVVNGDDYFYNQEQFKLSSILYTEQDIILPNESLPIEVARGCIFSCAYCHFDLIGKKVGDWTKTSDTIKNEMIRNYELFGTTHYMFSDELINESISKMEMLHDVVAKLPFKIRYTAYARIDLIRKYPEMRELLLQTGAASLAFGIETFNESAGKAVGKGMHPEKVKETLHYCNELWKGKIITSSNFIVGLPGETEDDIWKTVDYLVSDDSPLDVFGFLPLHIRTTVDGRSASRMDNDPKKFGYIIQNGSWTTNNMSFEQSKTIVKKIYADSRVIKRTQFSAATWIGRILALGYSVDEIFSMIHDTTDHDLEILNKTNLLKEEYFKKLML
jgi:hypothetical protein